MGQQCSAGSEMPGHKAVILHLNPAILIIEGRTVEGIAHHLPPMLPAGEESVIVIVVTPTDMVAHGRSMIMIDGAALVFRIQILYHYIVHSTATFEIEFHPEHHVGKGIEEIAVFLTLIPFIALAIAIIIEHEHRAMVFKIFVGIDM